MSAVRRSVWLILLLFVIAFSGYSPAVLAVPTCFTDVHGPNDPSGDGQGDITRLCLDTANVPTSFDVYMSWDETSFSG